MLIVNFLLTWLVVALSLLLTAYFVPGFEFNIFGTAAVGALILVVCQSNFAGFVVGALALKR